MEGAIANAIVGASDFAVSNHKWDDICDMLAGGSHRILLLTTEAHGGFGGIAVYNIDLVNALASSPLVSKVDVVPRLVREPPVDVPANVTIHEGASRSTAAFVATALAQARKPFDLVMCGHLHLLPIATLVARIRRVPLVNLLYGFEAWDPSPRLGVNRLARRCDLHLSISPTTTDRFLEWTKLSPDRVFALPNAVHADRFGIRPKPAYLLDRYGLHGKRIVMSLGRLASLERQKGMDELIEIAPTLRDRIADVAVLIVGDGEDRKRLEDKVQALGLQDLISFAGRIPDSEKADHFSLCDVFSMVGRQEGFGFVFLEALATGARAVGSSLDGSRDALLDGELGDLADPDHPETIADAICRAMTEDRHIPERLAYYSFAEFRRRLDGALEAMLQSVKAAA